jgi:tight adherence protein B
VTVFYLLLASSLSIFAGLALWVLVHADRAKRRHHARLQRGITAPRVAPLSAPRRLLIRDRSRDSLHARIDALISQTGLHLTSMELCVQVTVLALAIYGLSVLFLGIHPVSAMLVAVVIPGVIAAMGLRIARKRYQAAFSESLPEALDVFARGLRAGRPISDSLRIVVETTSGPVKAEFARCHGEICMGTSLPDSLAALYGRLRTPEIGFFAVATALQAETGGNLIETLENLAGQLRERRKLRKKARALSSEARVSALILASLPFAIAIALFVLNGAYLAPLYTDPRGQVMAAVALTSVSMGVYIMVRMGKLDV